MSRHSLTTAPAATRSTTSHVLGRAARRTTRKARRRGEVKDVRRLGEDLSIADGATAYEGPARLAALRRTYVPREEVPLLDGRIPLIWWTDTANFGDLLSPWLIGRIAERPVVHATRGAAANIVAVGSVVGRARAGSIVWGSGAFGSERRSQFNSRARYRAVRGPLTRSKLLDVGIECPRVYGDPALLVPMYFWPRVEQTHDVGVVVRHSENQWKTAAAGESVQIIDFASMAIEDTLRAMLACRRIVSSSLHGLILADAYGIPNAWLGAERAGGGSRPNGGEFKYLDYFASVNKLRRPQHVDLRGLDLDAYTLQDRFDFDGRPIEFDHEQLLDACPVARPVNGTDDWGFGTFTPSSGNAR